MGMVRPVASKLKIRVDSACPNFFRVLIINHLLLPGCLL